jgi:hypothetical protein
MDTGHYVLQGREVLRIPCDIDSPTWETDLLTWAKWLEGADLIVARTFVGPIRIATDFLGLDHNFMRFRNPHAEPLVFETMVFGGTLDEDCDRCSTYDQAEEMHARMLRTVWASIPIIPHFWYWTTDRLWQQGRLFWRFRALMWRMDHYRSIERKGVHDLAGLAQV